MPGGDRTGPAGMGPMTGRAAGYCAGFSTPGYMNPYGGRLGLGFGWGRGRGRGFAWRRQFYASGMYPNMPYSQPLPYAAPYGPDYSEEKEIELLQNQGKFLQDQLNEINNRIKELESKEKEK